MFIKSTASLDNVRTEISLYSLAELKAMLNNCLTGSYEVTLTVKQIKEIYINNNLEVSEEKATSKMFWQQMIRTLADYWFWNKPIKQFDKDGNEVGQGVNENLSSAVVEVTGNEVNLANTTEITEIAEEQVTTVTSDNYKGIPVEHFTDKENETGGYYCSNDYSDTEILIAAIDNHSKTSSFYTATNSGFKHFANMSLALKYAKDYLATESEKINQAIASNELHSYAAVLGGNTTKQEVISEPLPGSVVLSPKHYLTPKLSLFTAVTNYTYLANCFTYLVAALHRFNVETYEWFSEISTAIFDSWFDVNYLIHKGYIKQPLPSCNDYVTMLQLINQVA